MMEECIAENHDACLQANARCMIHTGVARNFNWEGLKWKKFVTLFWWSFSV